MAQFLPLDTAGIISTVLEGVLYGFSVLMFIATLWILLRGRARINYTMVSVAALLFILSTIHLGVDINRLYSGLVRFRDSYPGGPPAWFANPGEQSFIFKNAVYSFQTALGDGVVIYRCYMVWRSFWIILLPSILWLAVSATSVGAVYTCHTLTTSTTSQDVFARHLGKWITSFYATTLVCNLVATGAACIFPRSEHPAAYRLWIIDRNVHGSRFGRGLTLPVLLVVIDAGALYSITLCAALICFVLKSNGQYVVLDMVTPIISIAFYMVILRVGLAAQNSRLGGNGTMHSSTIPRMPLPRGDPSDRFQPMRVHIEKLTEVDSGPANKASEAGEHQMARVE
ncbi:hypothetical protein B0H10DRAFT_2021988 [Mycena sp. CBHHK59/15]|nr:hypothetical protein B0H10DRAFT_2021988 [Mycena sp. CBHHK59/15]